MYAILLDALYLLIPTKWRSYRDHRLCDDTSPCVYDRVQNDLVFSFLVNSRAGLILASEQCRRGRVFVVLSRKMDLGVISLRKKIGNESVPIQLAQCWFPGPAISNAKYQYIFHIKYTEALLSNDTRKLLWFEVTKTLIAV